MISFVLFQQQLKKMKRRKVCFMQNSTMSFCVNNSPVFRVGFWQLYVFFYFTSHKRVDHFFKSNLNLIFLKILGMKHNLSNSQYSYWLILLAVFSNFKNMHNVDPFTYINYLYFWHWQATDITWFINLQISQSFSCTQPPFIRTPWYGVKYSLLSKKNCIWWN